MNNLLSETTAKAGMSIGTDATNKENHAADRTQRPHFISNTPMDYDWGIPDGIAKRLGIPETGEKQAELWFGAHPIRPSKLAGGGTVDDLERTGAPRLPFLLKVLAIGEVLSIQAHPTADMAAQGFVAEEAAGIPLTAKHRNFKDPNPKPEMVVALDDGFQALCGFRELVDTQELYRVLARTPDLSAEEIANLTRLEKRLTTGDFGDVVTWILTAGEEVQPLRQSLGHALRVYAASVAQLDARPAYLSGADDFALQALARINEQYPTDPGVIFASLLNVVELQAGEALWLGTGTPHAYLSGFAVELMGPSDNVLRGGLTVKHVDPQALCDALKLCPQPPTRLEPAPLAGQLVYRPEFTPDDGVRFELVRVSGNLEFSSKTPSCVLVINGQFTVSTGGQQMQQQMLVNQAEAVWAPAGDIKIFGAGLCFVATDYNSVS